MLSALFFIDEEGHLLANYNRFWVIPVLEFDKIGKDGDFRGALTYTLTKDRGVHGGQLTHVSKNMMPKAIKNYYRDFARSSAETVENVPKAAICVPEGMVKDMTDLFRKRRKDPEAMATLTRINAYIEQWMAERAPVIPA